MGKINIVLSKALLVFPLLGAKKTLNRHNIVQCGKNYWTLKSFNLRDDKISFNFLTEHSVKLRIVENVVIEFRNRSFKDL